MKGWIRWISKSSFQGRRGVCAGRWRPERVLKPTTASSSIKSPSVCVCVCVCACVHVCDSWLQRPKSWLSWSPSVLEENQNKFKSKLLLSFPAK